MPSFIKHGKCYRAIKSEKPLIDLPVLIQISKDSKSIFPQVRRVLGNRAVFVIGALKFPSDDSHHISQLNVLLA